MSWTRAGVWQALMGAAALLVLVFFLVSMRDVLNPFVLFLLVIAALLPFRGLPGHTVAVALATLLALFWVLTTTGFLLAPFVLALILAYILDPVVDALEARGMGRSLAILVLALPVVGAVVVGVLVGVPALAEQIEDLIQRAPVLLERFVEWVEGIERWVAGLPFPVAQETAARLREIDPAELVTLLEERQQELASRIWSGLLGLGRGLGSALSLLGYVVLTPVLAFYLLRDWDGLTATVGDLVPRDRRPAVLGFAREYDRLLSSYLRGQITVALTIGLLTAAGLWIVRFPYALTLGVVVAVFGVIPYVGLVLSLIPAILIALVSGSVLVSLLKVAVVYGVAQALEATVVSPRIVGGSVGLHPVWVVLALAVGGFYFGFVGLLIGVPLAVGAKLVARRLLARYRGSRFYRGVGAGDEGPGASSAGGRHDADAAV